MLPYLAKLPTSSDLVVDFETTGLDVLDPSFDIVGIGIASDLYPDGIYCPINPGVDSCVIMLTLGNHNLIAHNVSFDARCLEWYLRKYITGYVPMSKFPWKNDTQLMFKALANEGYPGQNWKLKTAQKTVLGWKETNEVELDAWLIANGFTGAKGKPDKSKMSLAPNHILGRYCGLDAQSTLALYNHFVTYYDQFPDMERILENEMMILAELEIEQFFHGLYIDVPLLKDRIDGVKRTMEQLLHSFYYSSDATPYIEMYNNLQVEAIADAEPPEFTKTGRPTVRYGKWKQKLALATDTMFFNANSKQQLAWLFYECLFDTKAMTEKYNAWKQETTYHFEVLIDDEWIKVDGTATGKYKVDKKILPKLGDAGRILNRYNELNKLLGYMNGMLESLRDGIHNVQLKLGGTLTFRCSGTGGVNIQQLPKVRDYLDCLVPRPGHCFIQMDVDALEPVVLAELSEDRAMMDLYGPNAKPNDIYLYVGASIPALRNEVCQYGYDPLNPTSEAIAITKKKAKRIRGICKVLHLSAGYGAGPPKIYDTLIQAGVEITLAEVKTIHKAYWELFGGVTEYQNKLKREYAANGGWFLNGRGMPISVAAQL